VATVTGFYNISKYLSLVNSFQINESFVTE
jgi:hypothetical protein